MDNAAQMVATKVESPKVCSVSVFAGVKVGRLADHEVNDFARQRMTGKPWSGLLPAQRMSLQITLGDAMAMTTVVSRRMAVQGRNLGLAASSSSSTMVTVEVW